MKAQAQEIQQLHSAGHLGTFWHTEEIPNHALHVCLRESTAQRDHLFLSLEHVVEQIGLGAIALIVTGGRGVTVGVIAIEQAVEIIVGGITALAWVVSLPRLLLAGCDPHKQEQDPGKRQARRHQPSPPLSQQQSVRRHMCRVSDPEPRREGF